MTCTSMWPVDSGAARTAAAPFTVAVMQPYFIPYAGYFRLFAASDLFVIYDCVQFPRRGWVHRNRLLDRSGKLRWLTLPLDRAYFLWGNRHAERRCRCPGPAVRPRCCCSHWLLPDRNYRRG